MITITFDNRKISIGLVDNRGGFLIESPCWVDCAFLEATDIVKIMLSNIKDYMRKHNKFVHNFNKTHCGYDCAVMIGDYFSFCGDGEIQLNFNDITKDDFVLAYRLYDAFFNDAFMPIED